MEDYNDTQRQKNVKNFSLSPNEKEYFNSSLNSNIRQKSDNVQYYIIQNDESKDETKYVFNSTSIKSSGATKQMITNDMFEVQNIERLKENRKGIE
jgi:hypothetical protein